MEYGQWIGEFHPDGRPDGFATLNLEKGNAGRCFACFVQAANLPAARIDFDYQINGGQFTAKSRGEPRLFNGNTLKLGALKDHPDAANITFSKEFTVEGRIMGSAIEGTWTGDPGTSGSFQLDDTIRRGPYSPNTPLTMSWSEYKTHLDVLLKGTEPGRYLFRGHCSSDWHLTSTLHRLGRYDLMIYRELVAAQLVPAVNATLSRQYRLSDPVMFGAFLSLAQHHQFPTPLLDWTKSPYVAAYFAFADRAAATRLGNSRIFIFDAKAWATDKPQWANIENPAPSVSIQYFDAYDNPRHIPQQACHVFTNVADIAAWIKLVGGSKQYMTVIDIPHSERAEISRDLCYMGVTAASMFPGLDGTCRSIKEQLYGFD